MAAHWSGNPHPNTIEHAMIAPIGTRRLQLQRCVTFSSVCYSLVLALCGVLSRTTSAQVPMVLAHFSCDFCAAYTNIHACHSGQSSCPAIVGYEILQLWCERGTQISVAAVAAALHHNARYTASRVPSSWPRELLRQTMEATRQPSVLTCATASCSTDVPVATIAFPATRYAGIRRPALPRLMAICSKLASTPFSDSHL